MTWTDICSIVLWVIGGLGGIGAVFTAVIKFSSNIIAERLAKKYEINLQKEMEKYKIELSKKDYVSKTRFDAEFKIYRDLSKTFCTAVKDISVLIPSGFTWKPAEEDAQKKYEDDCYQTAHSSVVAAQNSLYSCVAFIPEDFFKGYEDILKLCKQQLNVFTFRYNVLTFGTGKEKNSLSSEDYKRTDEINDMWMKHNAVIREYLSNLDVL